jgi:hypothetical protein
MSKAMQLVLVFLVVEVFSLTCRADDDYDCKFAAQRSAAMDVAGARAIDIRARAGSLTVDGTKGATRVEAGGRACASAQQVLDGIKIDARRENDVLRIEVVMPERAQFEGLGSVYASLDLRVSVPDNLPISVTDSSGDAEISRIASGDVTDSSGELRIHDVTGDLKVRDSSGDLVVRNVGGNVRLNDSSGDVRLDGIQGGVEVDVDSSGDLDIERVTRDVHVAQDSSGEIHIADVGGSVSIDSDGSGDVEIRRVKGSFTLGNKGSGEVRQADVSGPVNIER